MGEEEISWGLILRATEAKRESGFESQKYLRIEHSSEENYINLVALNTRLQEKRLNGHSKEAQTVLRGEA